MSIEAIAFAASAGGQAALIEILGRLPAGLPVPVFVAQHLAHDRESSTPQILARHTALKVKLAEHGEPIAPGTVYVAAPNSHLVVRPDHTLALTQTQRVHFARPSADVLFHSLARVYGKGVVAVVLTGSGSDAANGAVAIEHGGGLVIVQDPKTADYPSMPLATIRIDSPDYILPLDEIAGKLLALLEPEKTEL